MAKQVIGITYVGRSDQQATGVYESPDGIAVEVTDAPYLLSDGSSLMSPLPVFDAGGPTFLDDMGALQAALAVFGGSPPIEVEGAVVNGGIIVSNNSVAVVHTGA